MTEISNPYRPNEPVVDPKMLFGRRDAIDWIEQQLDNQLRVMVLSGLPLIGKTSLLKHAGQQITRVPAYHLYVALPPIMEEVQENDEDEQSTLDHVLWAVVEQLTNQLRLHDLIAPRRLDFTGQPGSVLRELFTEACQKTGQQQLVLYLDDLHHLVQDDMSLIASFLSTLNTPLEDCPTLHFVFTGNQDRLRRIRHTLIDRAPSFHLSTLPPDASINLVTVPVKDILRFDYGITRRITEINSHHPYYLTIFCHNLLNRQMFDGWVNQRDFDAVLGEILDSPIEPFRKIWAESSAAEQAVLSGMAAIRGAHGPITSQEIIRFLQRHNNAVESSAVINALEKLSERGVLIPMGTISDRLGAVSYRFHVELLRFWLREHTELMSMLRQVNWQEHAKRKVKKTARRMLNTAPRPAQKQNQPSSRRQRPWALAAITAALLCILASGTVVSAQLFGLPVAFLQQQPPPTSSTVTQMAAPSGEETIPNTDSITNPTPQITLTPAPTPPPVQLRTRPALTFMAREIDEGWRIYTMNADGSEVTPVSPTGADDQVPIWSPSGEQIAFVSQREGNREIYVMDVDGQNVINVTQHPADDWTPAWSHDGRRFAFSSLRTGRWEIYILDTICFSTPETCPNELRQITSNDNNNISPVWSPDDSRFAFNSKAMGNWNIYTMNNTGTDVKQITYGEANELFPVWSPDGSLLAFESNAPGDVDIFVVDSAGTAAPRNITNYPLANDHGPTWSPDSQKLVFYSNREGNWDIYSTTLDGQIVINLTKTGTRDEQTPAWRP